MNRENMHLRSYESYGWDELHIRRDDRERDEDLRVNMCGSDPAFAEAMSESGREGLED
jgi:hypothetical protein